jgi:hypothetical protein
MLRPAALAAYVRTWCSLSSLGRRFLWDTRRAKRGVRSARDALLNAADLRYTLLRSLRISDRAFVRHVPLDLCHAQGRDPYDAYRRFVPFTAFNLEVRGRTLTAFGLDPDEAALERIAILTMMTREWNDLQDVVPTPELVRLLTGECPQPPREALLLAHLLAACRTHVPRDRHPTFNAVLDAVPRYTQRPPELTLDVARERLERNSHAATLAALYAAREDIPPAVGEALKPFSLWFYELDGYVDLPRDRAARRTTLMTLVADPRAELDATRARAEARIREAAPRPDGLLLGMAFLSTLVEDGRRQGLDVESDVFFTRRPAS